MKPGQVIDDQSDFGAMLRGKLARQAPGNTDIAEVIDDPAKDVTGEW